MARARQIEEPADLPEADRIGDFPHPRETRHLVGHDAALACFAEAIASGRMHHAWLLTGPRGIGKATLAYRVARIVLAHGVGRAVPRDLSLDEGHPCYRRVSTGGHGDLLLLRRPWDASARPARFKTAIPVDEVRRAGSFFSMSAGEGGWRVCIVDSADELNPNAANALLKILEEPPQRALFLLISHAPGRLLPTIRSRCRKLPMQPLGDSEMQQLLAQHLPDSDAATLAALTRLGRGSPGAALALADQGGVDVYRELTGFLAQLPQPDIIALHALGDRLSRREGEAAYRSLVTLLRQWLADMMRAQATGAFPEGADKAEIALMQQLGAAAPLDQWLEVWDNIGQLAARADAVNLDRKQVILNIFTSLADLVRNKPR